MGDVIDWFMGAFLLGGVTSFMAIPVMVLSGYFTAHDVAPYLVGLGGIVMFGFFSILIALDALYSAVENSKSVDN